MADSANRAVTSILDRHPDISPEELKWEIRQRALGRRLADPSN